MLSPSSSRELTEDEKMEVRRLNEEALRHHGHVPGVERAPRRVDFNLVFPTEASRSEAKAGIHDLGFDWKDEDDSVEAGTFEATAHKVLTVNVDSISDSEIALSEALSPYGGYVDGWGYFGDTVH
jgi:hypothetical protein